MKKMHFAFPYTVLQKFMFKPLSGHMMNLSMIIKATGCVVEKNIVITIVGFEFEDTGFAFVEDNYKMWEDIYCKAMDEYKRLHCNAKPIALSVVELAEYNIVNIHPSLKHSN